MSRYIDADALIDAHYDYCNEHSYDETAVFYTWSKRLIDSAPTIDAVSVVRCRECRKSHIDGKTTHYLWCTEWGRSTDTFGYCERGEREGE